MKQKTKTKETNTMAIKRGKKITPVIQSFSDLQLPAGVFDGSIAFSQSLLMAGMQCDRQLIYQLNRWEKPGKEHNTFFGTCVHELLDVFYTLKEKPDDEMLEEALDEYLIKETSKGTLKWLNPLDKAYYETIIITTLSEYFKFYEDDFKMEFFEVERIFNVKYPKLNLWLTGKKDGKVGYDGKRMLLEHKTRGMINEDAIARNLDLNFQTQFYLLADRLESSKPCDGVLYNIIRRTKSKPRGKETLRTFSERLREEITKDPDYFFKRFEAIYTKEQTKEFEGELEEKLKHLWALLSGARKPLKNEAFCFNGFECDYANACASRSLEGYTQRKDVSPELQ